MHTKSPPSPTGVTTSSSLSADDISTSAPPITAVGSNHDHANKPSSSRSSNIAINANNGNRDLSWEKISLEARKSAPGKKGLFRKKNKSIQHHHSCTAAGGSGAGGGGGVSNTNCHPGGLRRQHSFLSLRSKRSYQPPSTSFSDIVHSQGQDLSDKIFLVVCRLLNDKDSLVGHFYRYLLHAFEHRCLQRNVVLATVASVSALSPKARRSDFERVVEHVVAIVLESQPGLASTPNAQTLTTRAVEKLILGELYDLIQEEIRSETKLLDAQLRARIDRAEHIIRAQQTKRVDNYICPEALETLRTLPEARSVEDKIDYAVTLLQQISDNYEKITAAKDAEDQCTAGSLSQTMNQYRKSQQEQRKSPRQMLDADALLRFVCQHIVIAQVDKIHAEVAFIHEYLRDDKLLRDRQGYSLVTLQAALEYLKHCHDFEREVFGPVASEPVHRDPRHHAHKNKKDPTCCAEFGNDEGEEDSDDDDLSSTSSSDSSADGDVYHARGRNSGANQHELHQTTFHAPSRARRQQTPSTALTNKSTHSAFSAIDDRSSLWSSTATRNRVERQSSFSIPARQSSRSRPGLYRQSSAHHLTTSSSSIVMTRPMVTPAPTSKKQQEPATLRSRFTLWHNALSDSAHNVTQHKDPHHRRRHSPSSPRHNRGITTSR